MQNEMQSEDLPDGNRRSRSTSIGKGARRDREPSRLPWKKILNLFNKSKVIKRYLRFHIMHSVPHSSALKILFFDHRHYLITRMCGSKPVEITRAKGSRLHFAIDYVYVFHTEELQSIKRHLKC